MTSAVNVNLHNSDAPVAFAISPDLENHPVLFVTQQVPGHRTSVAFDLPPEALARLIEAVPQLAAMKAALDAAAMVEARMGLEGSVWDEELRNSDPGFSTALGGLRAAMQDLRRAKVPA